MDLMSLYVRFCRIKFIGCEISSKIKRKFTVKSLRQYVAKK
ncbi:hypothetical protein CFII64_01161 [Pseudomonas sp. CFII64]|nr:hypothetical protein CFII64_01161 [Pseudomonas sp. CFII64]